MSTSFTATYGGCVTAYKTALAMSSAWSTSYPVVHPCIAKTPYETHDDSKHSHTYHIRY